MSDDATLRQAEQQMLAARPWDAAEHESLWSITGQRPGGSRFTDCLAMTFPGHITGTDKPLFAYVAPGLTMTSPEPIDPAWITHATPLLIVHRDEPSRTYWDEDQVWIR